MLIGGRPTVQELAEPPDFLPEEGKQWWRESVEQLVAVGLVDRIDRPVLEQLATQYARIRQAQRVIASEGHYARGSTGQIVIHPALKIERAATETFLKIAEHYALTPLARTRLGMAELERRSLQAELDDTFGKPELREVANDAEADVQDAQVVDVGS